MAAPTAALVASTAPLTVAPRAFPDSTTVVPMAVPTAVPTVVRMVTVGPTVVRTVTVALTVAPIAEPDGVAG